MQEERIAPQAVPKSEAEAEAEWVSSTVTAPVDAEARRLEELLLQALDALGGAARHLSAADVAFAESHMAERVQYRKLTQVCAEAATAVQEYLEEFRGLATEANQGEGNPISDRAGVVPIR